MKYAPLIFICAAGLMACRKNDRPSSPRLEGSWRFQSHAVLAIGPGACSYRTRPSDMDTITAGPPCRRDDVYTFTAARLRIEAGPSPCTTDEPPVREFTLSRTDSTLILDGVSYRIVRLMADTLLLEHCREVPREPWLPPVGPNYARFAEKYVRIR